MVFRVSRFGPLKLHASRIKFYGSNAHRTTPRPPATPRERLKTCGPNQTVYWNNFPGDNCFIPHIFPYTFGLPGPAGTTPGTATRTNPINSFNLICFVALQSGQSLGGAPPWIPPGGEGSRQTFHEFPPMTSAILAAGTGKTSPNFPAGWENPARGCVFLGSLPNWCGFKLNAAVVSLFDSFLRREIGIMIVCGIETYKGAQLFIRIYNVFRFCTFAPESIL